jgi:hypothetical protein
MPMATIHKMSQGSDLYHIHFLQPTDPGFGQPGGGTDPDYGQGRPRPDRPGNELPGSRPGGRPDNSLPGQGLHPGNRPPGSGNPAFPDNSLPSGPPPQVGPGEVVILIRDQGGVWHYAAIKPGDPAPPRPLPSPTPPNRPDNSLPGSGARPDQGLPETPQPKPA